MRVLVLSCSVALLVACSRADRDVATDTAAGATGTPGAATISLADVAGRWNVTAKPESGTDTSTTRYVLNATAETAGWTITFAQRPQQPVAVRVVAVGGDSIVTEMGPFESVRRRGVQVTARTVLRREGDRLVGSSRARYASAGADTVLVLRTQGTRAP
jgi:molybdopterin biosynthesis enzyme